MRFDDKGPITEWDAARSLASMRSMLIEVCFFEVHYSATVLPRLRPTWCEGLPGLSRRLYVLWDPKKKEKKKKEKKRNNEKKKKKRTKQKTRKANLMKKDNINEQTIINEGSVTQIMQTVGKKKKLQITRMKEKRPQ